MSDVTRRDFVKAASTVTAVAATTLPAWAIEEKREPVKIGFIGCGGRGTGAANQALTANGNAVIWAMGDAFGAIAVLGLFGVMSRINSDLF